jgi:peptide/nickel transport system permease protein
MPQNPLAMAARYASVSKRPSEANDLREKRHMHPVLKTVLQRLGLGLLTLLAVSVIIFSCLEFLPGGFAEAMLGQSATPETVSAFNKELGLDRPAVVRYFEWIGGAVVGDFGRSLAGAGGGWGNAKVRMVSEVIGPRLYNTFFLALMTAVIAVPIALALGLLCALYRNSWFDRIANGTTLTTIASPEFFVAYILAFLAVGNKNGFANALPSGWGPYVQPLVSWIPDFPPLATVSPTTLFGEHLWKAALPALTLTLVIIAHMMRMTRASVISLLASPYVEMAKLKGLTPSQVILRHALPNAWAPIATVIAFNLAYLVVGVVVVEVVFTYPGIGQLMVDSVSKRDMPVAQACALIFAATYITLNLLADVVAIVTNPRLLHPK